MRQVFFPTLHSEYIYLLRGNQYYYQNLALIFVHNHILHCGRRRMLFLSSPLHSLVSKQYFVRFNSGGIGDDSNRALPLQTYVIQFFVCLLSSQTRKMQLNFAFILEDKSAGGWEMHLCGFYSSLEKHTEHFYHFAPSQPYSFEMRLSIEREQKKGCTRLVEWVFLWTTKIGLIIVDFIWHLLQHKNKTRN